MKSRFALRVALLLVSAAITSVAADPERVVFFSPSELHVAPDRRSEKLGTAERGREAVVLDRTDIQGLKWVKVIASLGGGRNVTGWSVDRGLVRTTSANGDRVLFGEAVESEAEAMRARGRKGAAEDAMRLYYRVAEYWPKSGMAAEALWRAADVRWQLERAELSGRRSSREADPLLRPKMDEGWMKEVRKRFPGSKQAALATYALLDNKLCGDWQGLPKCPEREAELYEEYARENPQSPKLVEALFEAARRQAALIDIYKMNGDNGKAANARTKALATLQRVTAQAGEGDYGPRAARLVYMIENNIPVYGTAE